MSLNDIAKQAVAERIAADRKSRATDPGPLLPTYKITPGTAYGQRYLSLCDPTGYPFITAYESQDPRMFAFLNAVGEAQRGWRVITIKMEWPQVELEVRPEVALPPTSKLPIVAHRFQADNDPTHWMHSGADKAAAVKAIGSLGGIVTKVQPLTLHEEAEAALAAAIKARQEAQAALQEIQGRMARLRVELQAQPVAGVVTVESVWDRMSDKARKCNSFESIGHVLVALGLR